jgi:hypothetical protein
MARYGIPESSSLWQRHETLYLGIFAMALKKLSENGCDAINEDAISEELCPLLTEICFEESQKKNRAIPTPVSDGPIQPVIKAELAGGKTKKRPDFTCKLVNTFAETAEEHEISFHVECKLLGHPTSHTWILNKNYVTKGIKRFDSRSHEYGKRASSGMMLGYITSMTPDEILSEVNKHQTKHCPHNPAIGSEVIEESIRRYAQNLKRKSTRPREFKLIHLWVDLRKQQ